MPAKQRSPLLLAIQIVAAIAFVGVLALGIVVGVGYLIVIYNCGHAGCY
jgi:hypothetical protein